MIINEAAILALEPIITLRAKLKKRDRIKTEPHEQRRQKVRYFTERCEEGNFRDYERGKKLIDDLPLINTTQMKTKTSHLHKIFNFITREKPKSSFCASKPFYSETSEAFNKKVEEHNRTKLAVYLKRAPESETDNECESQKLGSYSMELQAFQESNNSKKAFLLKRKSYRLKKSGLYSMETEQRSKQFTRSNFLTPNSSASKSGEQSFNISDSEMRQLIKIQKKQLIHLKTSKQLINREKLMGIAKRQRQFFTRYLNSRISPWEQAEMVNDNDSF